MQVTLELSGHPKANVQQVVLTDTAIVGRSRVCALQIASPTVSRKHCEIRLSDEGATIIDLGSSNGTFLDSNRLPAGEERPLPAGCRLNIGGVRFVVRYETSPVSDAPTTVPAVAASGPVLPDEADFAEGPPSSEEPILPDESIATEEPYAADQAIPEDAPILNEEPLSAKVDSLLEAEPILDDSADFIPAIENEASTDEPDLAELFADTESGGSPVNADTESSEELVAEDEPILEADEDQAFSFLTDDEQPAASPKKRPDDSRIGDFLSQLGRD